MTASVNRYLYLPMEIASREMDSRLTIALFAVKAGIEVIIGQKWLMEKNVSTLPKGVWLFKTLTARDGLTMKAVKKAGHRVTALDEEIPGLNAGPEILRWVNPSAVSQCETVFCLGEQHFTAMAERFPKEADKFVIAGNPRWDVMRPDFRNFFADDIAKIQSEYGPFILVNTNAGLVNSAKGSEETLINKLVSAGKIDLSIPEDRKLMSDRSLAENANFASAPSLMRRLVTEFPGYNFVLRPHPTEMIEPYELSLESVPHVHVVSEGSAVPWIAASKALIHTNCTTGTEAFALGVNSICFHTIPSSFHGHLLSGKLSQVVVNEDEVISALSSILTTGKGSVDDEAKAQIFGQFFAAQEGASSAQLIVNSIAKMMKDESKSWKPGPFFRPWNWRSSYRKKIMPNYKPTEIAIQLQKISTVLDMHTPTVKRCGRAIYHITGR